MPVTIYESSKGPKVIADLPYPYLKNAAEKLRREAIPRRAAELAAMDARLNQLDLEREAAEGAATGAVPASPPPAPAAEMDPRLSIGGNHPPAAEPDDAYGAHAAHIDDLYIEAGNWADGADIENEAQAAAVDLLIDDFKEAIAAAIASRDAAKRPHQEKVTTIQEQYYPLIGETKAITGKAIRAKTTLLQVKTRWANKVAAIQAAEAKRLRDEATELARVAVDASRQAVGDLAATETAEDLIKTAQGALKAAKVAEKPTVKGMRDNYVVTGFDNSPGEDGKPTDGRGVLLRHYFRTNPMALVDFCLDLARKDILAGKRSIPGVIIANERRAA